VAGGGYRMKGYLKDPELDSYLRGRKIGYPGRCNLAQEYIIKKDMTFVNGLRDMITFKNKCTSHIIALTGGKAMETTDQLIKASTLELQESQKILEDVVNKINKLSGVVEPALFNFIKAVRSNRMAVVSELNQMLQSLKDVRNFFMDSDYDREMERLERFVTVCQEIRQLKHDGTFDAICDSAIKLAVKEK
jgi:polyhydroxyalkanoate synthesis regulator phasin